MSLRKVLGANVNALLGLLSWQLWKPVIWASLLAWPISAQVMNRWLDGFVSRVDVGPGTMLAATALVLLVVAATVLGLILRLSRVRPATVLREN